MARFVAVVGPTASGKSALALRLAVRLGAEIVACDSMQVYRGLDIGTAKPTAAEQAQVPHHLLDVVEPSDPFDAVRYAATADRALEAIAARGRPALVVGGTGLYLRALRYGLVDVPPADPVIRARHEALVEKEGPEALHAELLRVDPDSAATISPRDRVRSSRALEICEQTGELASVLRRKHGLGLAEPRHEVLALALPAPLDLRQAIERRVDTMLAAGWEAELHGLLQRGFSPTLRPLQAIGYRELGQKLAGELTVDDARLRIVAATWRYARRQGIWWRKEPGTTAVPPAPHPDDHLDVIWPLVESFLSP